MLQVTEIIRFAARKWRTGLVAGSLFALAAAAACGNGETNPSSGSSAASGGSTTSGGTSVGGGSASDTYEFASRFVPEASALNYTGQRFRLLLMSEMKAYIGTLTAAIDADKFNPGDIATTVAALDYYYLFDPATSGDDSLLLAATAPAGCGAGCAWKAMSWNDISANGARLQNKMAGNDSKTDHKDWSQEFVGWQDATIAAHGGNTTSPEGLLYAFFHTLGKQALDRENGVVSKVPGTSEDLSVVYVTPSGLDLQQLIQKLLLVGVAYAQGTDDYLDDQAYDDVKKGLLSSNAQDGDKPYSVLGHAWDEGFGYFGAARDYAHYTDEEIAGAGGRPEYASGYHDSNGDERIDVTREYNAALSVNCAKRDLGAKVPTDFTRQAIDAFIAGRQLILSAGDSLSSAELTKLQAYRDEAVLAWEKALAATVIHYVNDTVADTLAAGGDDYDFYAHAKHFSEMKAFALGFQFNPRSQLSDEEFVQIHTLMGDKPVLATEDEQARNAYVTKLQQVLSILESKYAFAEENVKGW